MNDHQRWPGSLIERRQGGAVVGRGTQRTHDSDYRPVGACAEGPFLLAEDSPRDGKIADERTASNTVRAAA